MRIMLTALITTVLLFGCANPAITKHDAFVEANTPLVAAGKMQWSDYYLGLYRIFADAKGSRHQSLYMKMMDYMVIVSIGYEKGVYSKFEFEAKQREVETDMAKVIANESTADRAAFAAALQGYGNARYGPEATKAQQMQIQPQPTYEPPKQIQCSTYGNQMNCTQY